MTYHNALMQTLAYAAEGWSDFDKSQQADIARVYTEVFPATTGEVPTLVFASIWDHRRALMVVASMAQPLSEGHGYYVMIKVRSSRDVQPEDRATVLGLVQRAAVEIKKWHEATRECEITVLG